MKVGILTLFHGNNNWGGVLQGYALKTLIEAEIPGTTADILIYKGKNIVYTSRIHQAMQYSPVDILRKTAKRLLGKRSHRKLLENRFSLFRDFMREYTTNHRVYNDETLTEAAREYDCLISGSDQVWNPNVGWAGFFQSTVTSGCRKVAYAASIARDDLTKHERRVMLPLIEQFDAVSVREKTAKILLEKYSSAGLEVAEVLDPVFLLSKEAWKTLSDRSTQQFCGDYAVAFFFSESKGYRDRILTFCKEQNWDLKFIPFAGGAYIGSDRKGEADRLYDLGPYEFLQLLRNARYIFTDSFHGAAFSIVFQKDFCVFERDRKSRVSKNSRVHDLLRKFGLSDRLICDMDHLEQVMAQQIDFESVRKLHAKYQEDSLSFLKQALGTHADKEDRKPKHVGNQQKSLCCGCTLCTAVCPQNCIQMKWDPEGFAYPYVKEAACTGCGLCLRVCQGKKRKQDPTLYDTYIGFHTHENIRAESSSGGLFYALANATLQKGGCVYGAGYAEDFSVNHQRATTVAELKQLMTSKYVQSDLQDTLLSVRQDLDNGHPVLFSGTPCQVAAVRFWTGTHPRRDKLLLVDFVCHGVPSPGVWNSYLRYLEHRHAGNIQKVSFRDKSKGWHDFHFRAEFQNSVLLESHELNAYMGSFLSNTNLRPSCYDCPFKNAHYFSDLTLADAWKIEKEYPQWADNKGTSLVVVRTDKGRGMLDQVGDVFVMKTASYDAWAGFNPSLQVSADIPAGRSSFFADFSRMDDTTFWDKYRKPPLQKQVLYAMKRAARFTGTEKLLRRLME